MPGAATGRHDCRRVQGRLLQILTRSIPIKVAAGELLTLAGAFNWQQFRQVVDPLHCCSDLVSTLRRQPGLAVITNHPQIDTGADISIDPFQNQLYHMFMQAGGLDAMVMVGPHEILDISFCYMSVYCEKLFCARVPSPWLDNAPGYRFTWLVNLLQEGRVVRISTRDSSGEKLPFCWFCLFPSRRVRDKVLAVSLSSGGSEIIGTPEGTGRCRFVSG